MDKKMLIFQRIFLFDFLSKAKVIQSEEYDYNETNILSQVDVVAKSKTMDPDVHVPNFTPISKANKQKINKSRFNMMLMLRPKDRNQAMIDFINVVL